MTAPVAPHLSASAYNSGILTPVAAIVAHAARLGWCAARRLPAHFQDVTFTERDGRSERAYRERRLGKFGAASGVRRINPAKE